MSRKIQTLCQYEGKNYTVTHERTSTGPLISNATENSSGKEASKALYPAFKKQIVDRYNTIKKSPTNIASHMAF